MDRKKHILFLSSWFPNRIHPTLGNFVQRHAEAVALFAQVSVLYLIKDPNATQIELVDTTENNVRIVRVYYASNGFLFSTRKKALQLGIQHLLNSTQRPDLIQLNMIWPEGWQAVFLSKKLNVPFVISDNWTGYHPNQRGPLPFRIKHYMRWVANKASLLLPVTEQLQQAMRALHFTTPSCIVPNVVNLQYFKQGVINETQIKFLHVSHLDDAHKNVSGILQAWKSIQNQLPNAEFHIGGDGDSKPYFTQAEKLGLKNIYFFGPMNQEEVAEKMQTADVFVLFSNYENLPLVMIEAMACGLLVIATDVGGVKEHINPELGHQLIAPKNTIALENALLKAANSASTRPQKQIIDYAKTNFSYEAVGAAFMKAYEKVWTN